jgi:hypothetical protein
MLDLPAVPDVSAEEGRKLLDDYERLAASGLPADWDRYAQERYGVRLSSRYGPHRIRNCFGKASGQLSLTAHQVKHDADSGLGFVVLKTVIAEEAGGQRSMGDWASRETRMKLERIRGRSGEEGWTVTWLGRGWGGSLSDYLRFYTEAVEIARPAGMLVVPSCKYHLPGAAGEEWREEEYRYTIGRLLAAAEAAGAALPMPLEKDFSPTLAGSDRASERDRILGWLRRVPALIRVAGGGRVALGIKVFNALFDDDFQLAMVSLLEEAPVRPDYLVYANRLFDPDRVFQGWRGVAYGGPDLSDRNLRVLSARRQHPPAAPLPLSATGNIDTGRRAAQYLLCGASSFQMHTLFQWPDTEFAMRVGSKTARALHWLVFHPEHGFVAWLLDFRRRFNLPADADVFEVAATLLGR